MSGARCSLRLREDMSLEQLSTETMQRLGEALQTESYTKGKTHNFYLYPARFHPHVARTVIESLTEPRDVVFDPFMGGGTAVVEALSLGRRVLATDINSLATFVSNVRTTPLSSDDGEEIRRWANVCAEEIPFLDECDLRSDGSVRNLPRAVEMFMVGAMQLRSRFLSFPRQHDFARCALLRLGQLALDCRDFAAPRRRRLASQFPGLVESMLSGLHEFVEECRLAGTPKNRITSQRLLLHRSAVGVDCDPNVVAFGARPRLVFTSPPYPGVHVLYHRWQYRGRKETAAPYWIANIRDGHGGAFYTAGSRTPTGLQNYFLTIKGAFGSVRKLIHDDGLVVQLVGFSDISAQLPTYLTAMNEAGFEEASIAADDRLWRRVANRKWYAKLQERADASTEVLLIHRPKLRS